MLSDKVAKLRDKRLSKVLTDNTDIPYFDEMFVCNINDQMHTITKQGEDYKVISITDPMDLFMYQYGKHYRCLDEANHYIKFASEKEAIAYTKLKLFW